MPVSAKSSTALAHACFLSKPRCRVSTSAICAPTRITGLSAVIGSWNTMPISRPRSFCRARSDWVSKSLSQNFRRPSNDTSGFSRIMPCANTVLPLPLSPTNASFLPVCTVRLTSCRTCLPGKKAFRFSISRMGFVMVSRSSENGKRLESNRQYPPHGQKSLRSNKPYLMVYKKRAQQTSAFCFSDDL